MSFCFIVFIHHDILCNPRRVTSSALLHKCDLLLFSNVGKLNFTRPPLFKKVFLSFPPNPAMLAAKRQDGGLFKSPPYPGYPFIMIPDLTSPYLPNGSLSPTARTVSSFILQLLMCSRARRSRLPSGLRECCPQSGKGGDEKRGELSFSNSP